MNDLVLHQFKVIVQRTVRPVRTSLSQQRRMREELLSHLTNVYDQELERCGDEQITLDHTKRRFGNPSQLSQELQRSVSRWDRAYRVLERFRLEPGESLLHFAGKVLIVTAVSYTIGFLLMLPLMFANPRSISLPFILHVVAVMAVVMAAFQFSFMLVADRICRALFGTALQRSKRRATWYCLAALAIFPGLAIAANLGLRLALPDTFYLLVSFLTAPFAPVLIALLAREEADAMRDEEEWAKIEVQ